MRRIMSITGTRAEYGLLEPVLKAINEHPDLELSLIVAGMHLSKRLGMTVAEIDKNNIEIAAKIESLVDEDTGTAMAKSVGNCLLGTIEALEKGKPDILLIIADIGPTLAGAIAGAYMNIPVAHIHGGDISGSVDDFVRHAITKLSHIHFAATDESAERIRKLGEEEFRIHVVGAPGLDSIINNDFTSPEDLSKKYNINLSEPLVLLLQHAVSTEIEDAENQIKATMEAVSELKYQTLIIYPNADAGGRKIINIIENYRKEPNMQIHKSLPHRDYLGILRIASVMVGNSSSGIIEAPSFSLPVVNIGSRQQDRQRAVNVIDVKSDRAEITGALQKALSEEFREAVKNCDNPYGDGKTGPRIAKILNDIKIDKALLQKKIMY